MKLGIISDTHIPKRAKRLPKEVLKAFCRVDRIFHLGDVVSDSVIFELEQLAPLTAVRGNMDADLTLPEQWVGEVGSFTLAAFHGNGYKTALEHARERARALNVDCVLFGHSHQPHLSFQGKTMLFNPGSATDKRTMPYYSFGIIEVGDTLRAAITLF